MSTVAIQSLDKGGVRRAMDEYARSIQETHPEVQKIVVFGSFIMESYAPGSDIDVVVVLQSSDKPLRARVPDFLPGAFPVGMDVFPVTREELVSLPSPRLRDEIRRVPGDIGARLFCLPNSSLG